MSVLSLRLPNSLHEKVREWAEHEGISLNQFIATAVAEKLSVLLGKKYLEERARRADSEIFKRILDRVPDVPSMPGDELPEVAKPAARARRATRSARTTRRRTARRR